MVLGLTGTIAAGKSTVRKILEDADFHVIDADSVGHSLLSEKSVQKALIGRFGGDILVNDLIDRKALAAKAFADQTSVSDLNAILHPLIAERIKAQLTANVHHVIDAALLFEVGLDKDCDQCWFVDAPRAQREARLGVAKASFLQREQYQTPYEPKRDQCDAVIINDGDLTNLLTR